MCLKALKLGAEWQSYTDALAADPKVLTDYEALKNRLISEQNRRLSQVEEKDSSRAAMNAAKDQHQGRRNDRRKFDGKCHNCGKTGHKKDTCMAYRWETGRKMTSF